MVALRMLAEQTYKLFIVSGKHYFCIRIQTRRD